MPFEVLKISTIAFKLIIKIITVLHSVFKSVFKLEIHPLILLLKPRMTPNEIQGLNTTNVIIFSKNDYKLALNCLKNICQHY